MIIIPGECSPGECGVPGCVAGSWVDPDPSPWPLDFPPKYFKIAPEFALKYSMSQKAFKMYRNQINKPVKKRNEIKWS